MNIVHLFHKFKFKNNFKYSIRQIKLFPERLFKIPRTLWNLNRCFHKLKGVVNFLVLAILSDSSSSLKERNYLKKETIFSVSAVDIWYIIMTYDILNFPIYIETYLDISRKNIPVQSKKFSIPFSFLPFSPGFIEGATRDPSFYNRSSLYQRYYLLSVFSHCYVLGSWLGKLFLDSPHPSFYCSRYLWLPNWWLVQFELLIMYSNKK